MPSTLDRAWMQVSQVSLDHSAVCALGLAPELAMPPPGGPRVDICLFHLSPSESGWRDDSSVLSAEEALIASHFVFAEHRRRFVQSHCALRRILGKHCGMAPEKIEFGRGLHGRPYVQNAMPLLDFNMSHSGDWAVVAVSFEGWVGIDLEAIDREGMRDLADSVLTPLERRDLASVPEAQRVRKFIAYWTAKESFMKLNGLGLGIPPESIEVLAQGSAVASCETASEVCRSHTLAAEQAFLTRIVAIDTLSCTLATSAPPSEVSTSW